MNEPTWLTEEELVTFTGYQHRHKQQMALAQMGIPFKVNPRGRVLVTRHDAGAEPRRIQKKATPNWDALKPKAA